METKQKKGQGFSSRMGLMLTLIGAAIGAGNFWRFPRVATLNGGGAFLIAYVVIFFCFAIPIMWSEHAMGRSTRHGLPGAFKDFVGKKCTWMGIFMTVIVILIMSTFTTVCAWVLRYLVYAVTNSFAGTDTTALFAETAEKDPITVVLFFVILMFCCFVVSKGISGGIEKSMKFMIPILGICVIIIAVKSVMLPGATEGLQYLFHIDTAYLLKANTWLEALAQTAWSMGPGFGLILSYAVYTQSKSDITLTTVTQGLSDTAIAIVASTAICCSLFATLGTDAAYEVMASGSNGLCFIALPNLFATMNGGYILGVCFFVALFMAVLTSNFGHIAVVSLAIQELGISKKKAVWYTGIVTCIVGIPATWSMDIMGRADWISGTLLVFGALFVCYAVWKFGAKKFRERFLNTPYDEFPIGRWFELTITVIAPLLTVVVLVGWIYQSFIADPSGAFNPLGNGTVGALVVQGGLIILVTILFNDKVADRIKHKYFNGETFPEIPPEHYDDAQ
ncbi:MAG: sodium-dependent transporter [Firmicutes bacterium]|nr:sodium-dependent transporter [Bacillota bacterium]